MANNVIVPAPSPTFDLKKGLVFWAIAGALAILWLLVWHDGALGHWVHFLLVLVVLIGGLGVHKALRGQMNIVAEHMDVPKWDATKPTESLLEIHSYVIREAIKSTEWYWKHKGAKAFFSQVVRFLAWILAAVSGLLPIVGNLLKHPSTFENSLWASLLLGIAAALVGLDKAFGYSSGWARYVLTATNIRKSLEDFRLDWADLMAKAVNPITTSEQVTPMIERARQFRNEVEALVLQETKDWVTEFQSGMAQMEKDVAAQLTTLKAQVDKTIQAREEASQPGAMQVNIQSNGKTTAGTVKALLMDSKDQVIAEETLAGFTWPKAALTPGIYHLRIEVPENKQIIPLAQTVIIKPGEITTVAITL
jgi:hypothetical protein